MGLKKAKMKTSPVLAVFLVSLVLVECSLFNTVHFNKRQHVFLIVLFYFLIFKVSDELKIKTLLANKTGFSF